MKDLNSCTFIGRLTRDAELKHLPSGAPVVAFSLAVNGSEKDGDGWKDRASFFDMAYFGKPAEAVNPYLKKGQQVAVTAEAVQDRWEKDGEKHQRVKFTVRGLQLLGGKKEQSGTNVPDHPDPFPDDIPF